MCSPRWSMELASIYRGRSLAFSSLGTQVSALWGPGTAATGGQWTVHPFPVWAIVIPCVYQNTHDPTTTRPSTDGQIRLFTGYTAYFALRFSPQRGQSTVQSKYSSTVFYLGFAPVRRSQLPGDGFLSPTRYCSPYSVYIGHRHFLYILNKTFLE